MRALILGVTMALLFAASAMAEPIASSVDRFGGRPARYSWRLAWPSATEEPAAASPAARLIVSPMLLPAGRRPAAPCRGDRTQRRVPDAREDSQVRELRDAAAVRHRSRARPVALQHAGPTTARKAPHAVVGAGIVGLFGVNTVTGAWNLFGEGRQGQRRAHAATRARAADDGRRRRLSRDDGDGAEQRTARRAHL